MDAIVDIVVAILLGLAVAGTLFLLAAVALVGRYQPHRVSGDGPPATILKPLHGAEPALAANLATAFAQLYGAPVQIIAGARNADDPALGIIAQVAADHPLGRLDVVNDATRHGANNKLSNLANMANRIRYPLVVIADSHVAWSTDTLAQLAAALEDGDVGLVSCLHAGRGDAGLWSVMAAMDISYRYMPSVIVGTALGLANATLGPTMALRRETLAEIGGFEAFADLLADDYEIGRAVRKLGLKSVLPRCFVAHGCCEQSLYELVMHELRWSLTIRRIDPAGYSGTLLLHSFPLALCATIVDALSPESLVVLGASLLARIAVKLRMDAVSGIVSGPILLIPLRDLLSFAIYWTSFFVQDVDWRGSKFRVTRDGKLQSQAR